MKLKKERPAVPYTYLIDNFKVLLIFLVVFNHIIAFNLVKVDTVVRYVWYAITIFHMPAFIFVSGYLSKKPQNVLKNFKNLLIPYIMGYGWDVRWITRFCVLPEQLCGIFWRCLSTVLPLKHWVRSDLLFRSASLLHCGQEQDRSLQRFYQHQELWYFSRSLLQDIS